MSHIPIIDSLAHPTPSGAWLSEKFGESASAEQLLLGLSNARIGAAICVAMPTIAGVDLFTYPEWLATFGDHLIPVACVDARSMNAKGEDAEELVDSLLAAGHAGIKVHPRLSDVSILDPRCLALARAARRAEVPYFLCTYFHDDQEASLDNHMESLRRFLYETRKTKMVLLHGMGPRVLELTEIVRHYPDVLVDLSFTLCRYEGSSVDLDIHHLFRTFDRRISIGSDYPEFTPIKLRERFESFRSDLSAEKAANIGYRNLEKLFGRTLRHERTTDPPEH